MLIQYVRNKKGQRRGVVIAVGAYKVGWSFCCKKDSFDKELGQNIAINRARYGVGPTVQVPADVKPVLEHMRARAQKYFKQTQVA